MEFILATEELVDEVFAVVKASVEAVYPAYYSEEMIRFFLELHGPEQIRKDILKLDQNGRAKRDTAVYLLRDQGRFVATGTVGRRHLTRAYVVPESRKKGYGTAMMDFMEKEAALLAKDVIIESSVPARTFYERRGYREVRNPLPVKEDTPAFILMQKKFR